MQTGVNVKVVMISSAFFILLNLRILEVNVSDGGGVVGNADEYGAGWTVGNIEQ